MELWGPLRNWDFWTARALGMVGNAERRAVRLLRSLCDLPRSSLYCVTGRLAAVGNVTRTVYLIRRRNHTLELRDGRIVASWCISIGPHGNHPPTDNVIALKNLIEGQEMAFRRTGNRGPFMGHRMNCLTRHSCVVDPLETRFGPDPQRIWDPVLGDVPDGANAPVGDVEGPIRAIKEEWERHRSRMAALEHEVFLPLCDARNEQRGSTPQSDPIVPPDVRRYGRELVAGIVEEIGAQAVRADERDLNALANEVANG